MTEPYHCAICGEPVDPQVDILYKAGSKSLFPVHRGECAETVRDGVVTVRKVLERRFPMFKATRKFLTAVLGGK
jgi:hypothetical protein